MSSIVISDGRPLRMQAITGVLLAALFSIFLALSGVLYAALTWLMQYQAFHIVLAICGDMTIGLGVLDLWNRFDRRG